jgi:hypothetical protein
LASAIAARGKLTRLDLRYNQVSGQFAYARIHRSQGSLHTHAYTGLRAACIRTHTQVSGQLAYPHTPSYTLIGKWTRLDLRYYLVSVPY